MNKAPIKLGKEDSQIFLYAKHHFKDANGEKGRVRSMDDVRLLIAAWSGSYGQTVADYDIMGILIGLARRLGIQDKVCDIKFMSKVVFGGEYGRPVRFNGEVDKTPIERFVNAVLDEIVIMQVYDGPVILIECESIDPTIFQYDAAGYDKDGFDRRGLTKDGHDRDGNKREYF